MFVSWCVLQIETCVWSMRFMRVSKPVVCLYDEPVEDDKAGEIKESGRAPRDVKSVKD